MRSLLSPSCRLVLLVLDVCLPYPLARHVPAHELRPSALGMIELPPSKIPVCGVCPSLGVSQPAQVRTNPAPAFDCETPFRVRFGVVVVAAAAGVVIVVVVVVFWGCLLLGMYCSDNPLRHLASPIPGCRRVSTSSPPVSLVP